ncbi:putative ABC transport system permease protein [Propionicimonas paludicola]|uniref:Putative ABC transport system permease protein n=1 Tax=Propionicimonas paludicola TaxID=185243 RepID=A0A2A9CV18_9ACTN|nr:FtsX-like permease family protein [Propionicimonas paludicola]PFG17419.1 putative ABC transport system permease protein [Propionicimonas paludicola]
MRLTLTLAWRYLFGRGARSLLTTLAVSLGVMLTFGLNGISPAMEAAFTRNLLSSAGAVDLTVADASGQPFAVDVADRVARTPGVAAVSPELQRTVILSDRAVGSPGQLTVVGVDPALAPQVRDLTVDAGRGLAPGDRAVMLVTADLAGRLDLTIGDTLAVPSATGSTKLRLIGLLAGSGVPGQDQAFIPLAQAQQLFSLGGRITTVQARADDGADRGSLERTVQDDLGSSFTVGGLSSNASLLASLQVSKMAFLMFSLFALATAGFIILNSFRTVVAQRRRDIGMLRAIGARRRTILGLFLAESLLQGVVGTGLGLLLGWGMAVGALAVVESTVYQAMHMQVDGPVFTPQTWGAAIVLGVGVTVAAALIPARSAARVSPLEAIRPPAAEVSGRRSGVSTWVGLGMLLAATFGLFSRNTGLVCVGAVLFLVAIALLASAVVAPAGRWLAPLLALRYPREGPIAAGNLQRSPGRSGVTVTVVMLGLSAIVALVTVVDSNTNGFMGYLDRSMSADYLIIPQSIVLGQGNVAAGPELARRVADVPGVAAVTTLRLSQVRTHGGGDVQVIGIDPSSYLKVGDFDWSAGSSDQAISQLRSGRWVIANGVYAAAHQLVPGQQVALETPNGVRSYLVAGIGNDYLNAELSTVYTSHANLARDFNTTADLMVMANQEAGADPAQVEAALQRVTDAYPAFKLYQSAAWKAEQLQLYDSSMIVFDALIAALALPSLLALINTMAISVLARTREIGMLRAVGATRRQIRRVITAESVLLAVIGTVLGVVAGLWLGFAMVLAMRAVGWQMPFSFPWAGIAVAVVVGLVFGVMAARGPARSASRLQVVVALHQE